MRATTIRTIDNVEIIVPNESFLTNAVTTYTKTDRRVRVMVPFGVSYDCDPNLVRRLALQTAAEHEMVLSDPPPSLLFRAFGESSMDFELAVWMDRPARRARLRSDLYYLLWEVFDENKIELPFPQRDIHIKGGPETWRALAQTDPAQDAPHEGGHTPGGAHQPERGRPAASGDIAESSGETAEASGDTAEASGADGENDWLGDDPSGR